MSPACVDTVITTGAAEEQRRQQFTAGLVRNKGISHGELYRDYVLLLHTNQQ